MPEPYDSRGKKANEVNTYDVFGRHRAAGYPQNYNNSEAIARRSSAGLAQLLDTGFADYSQI